MGLSAIFSLPIINIKIDMFPTKPQCLSIRFKTIVHLVPFGLSLFVVCLKACGLVRCSLHLCSMCCNLGHIPLLFMAFWHEFFILQWGWKCNFKASRKLRKAKKSLNFVVFFSTCCNWGHIPLLFLYFDTSFSSPYEVGSLVSRSLESKQKHKICRAFWSPRPL